MTNREMALYLGIAGIATTGIAYAATENSRNNRKRVEIESTMPAEYWEAKKAETEADVKKHQIDIESEARLKIDARNREDERRKAQMEFEKNAPDSYWQAKIEEAREETTRKIAQQNAETERIRAKQQAEQVRSIERAVGTTMKSFNS